MWQSWQDAVMPGMLISEGDEFVAGDAGMGKTMKDSLLTYKKKKDFLICLDSDGCVMDTMDIKHIRCFGPCMVSEWKLEEWEDEVLARWNEINLYTMTRGVNRFKGLAKALREIHEKYREIEGLDDFERWVEKTPELSNKALERELEQREGPCLRRAYDWSIAVNQSVDRLPREDKRPFAGVRSALKMAHESVDLAVVSSANRDAVMEEWEEHELLEYVDVVLAQDSGSKASCIGALMEHGYAKEHVLMCGDAAGDMEAAKKNGVFYYPVMVRHEAQSWNEFVTEGLAHFLDGTYGGTYQDRKIKEFLDNLKERK